MGSIDGIVAADRDRLILRPAPLLVRRKELLLLLTTVAVALTAGVAGLAWFFRPHVTYGGAIVLALFLNFVTYVQFTRQVTFIVLRGAEGIDIETRNRLLRTRRRRVLHRYRDIESVRLRERIRPNRSTLHDVLLVKRGRTTLFWFTRERESAERIARAIAELAGVTLTAETSSRS